MGKLQMFSSLGDISVAIPTAACDQLRGKKVKSAYKLSSPSVPELTPFSVS